MKNTLPFLLVLAVCVVLVLTGCRVSRAGYESAPYKVVRSDGDFELRDYPPLKVVETPMVRNGTEDTGSFNRLFGYITGRNAAEQKISMTTPVLMSGKGESRTMAFVLPPKLPGGRVPRPEDATVTVREVPAGRFAVLRFSGARSAKVETEALVRLKAWMVTNNLPVQADPVYGYFDPPWTPSSLRRNEVMLQTSSGN